MLEPARLNMTSAAYLTRPIPSSSWGLAWACEVSCLLPDAEVCLDWIHVTETLWTAGQPVFAEGSAELALWVTEQLDLLRRGWVNPILQNLMGAFIGIT